MPTEIRTIKFNDSIRKITRSRRRRRRRRNNFARVPFPPSFVGVDRCRWTAVVLLIPAVN